MDDHSSIISQFYEVSGLEQDSEADNVNSLLSTSDWDLSVAISRYFDNGFDLVGRSRNSNDEITTHSTAFDQFDQDESSRLTHRRESFNNPINLQNQMLLDNMLPRLPRAPPITNQWHFELGIHLSKYERNHLPKSNELGDKGGKKNEEGLPLWIVLLFIPKTILSFLLSIIRIVFGGVFKGTLLSNSYPKKFDYPKYFDSIQGSEKEKESKLEIDKLMKEEPSFNELHSKSQKKYEWLLILLVDNDEQCQKFAQEFETRQEFQEMENVIFYHKNIDKSPEGHEVGVVYKAKKAPYIVLCGNVTNNPSLMGSMSMVFKTNLNPGAIESDAKITDSLNKVFRGLNRVMDNYGPQLVTQRYDQQEIEFARMIKEQQDAAYTESLAKDKQKKEEKLRLETMARTNLQLRRLRNDFLLSQMGLFDVSQNESNPQSLVKLAIKLPGGSRIIETFNKQLTTEELYFFVELKLYIRELISLDENEFEDENDILLKSKLVHSELTIEEYVEKFPFKFELIQPFPKKVIKSGTNLILDTKELRTGANLLVEFVEDSDDDEDDEEEE